MTTTPMTTTGRLGTRWGRAVVILLLGIGLTGAMTAATVKRVLGFDAVVTIMNPGTGDLNGMSLSSKQIDAVDAGFGMAPVKLANGTWKNVLRAGFAGATITGLCVSRTESIPVLGNYTVRLTSPSTSTVAANNGVFDLTDIVGDQFGNGINLSGSTQVGLSTTDITTVSPAGGSGPPYAPNPFGTTSSGMSPLDGFDSSLYTAGSNLGNWTIDGLPHTFGGGWTGIDVAHADLYNVAGRLWQVQLTGHISLPKVNISVSQGSSGVCATWPTDPPYTNNKSFP